MAYKKESENALMHGELRDNAKDEIADIFIYLIAFCNQNNIDIKQAIDKKMAKNKKNILLKLLKVVFNLYKMITNKKPVALFISVLLFLSIYLQPAILRPVF